MQLTIAIILPLALLAQQRTETTAARLADPRATLSASDKVDSGKVRSARAKAWARPTSKADQTKARDWRIQQVRPVRAGEGIRPISTAGTIWWFADRATAEMVLRDVVVTPRIEGSEGDAVQIWWEPEAERFEDSTVKPAVDASGAYAVESWLISPLQGEWLKSQWPAEFAAGKIAVYSGALPPTWRWPEMAE